MEALRYEDACNKAAAVRDLRRNLAARLVNGIGNSSQIRHCLIVHPHLIGQRSTVFLDCDVGHGRHAHTAFDKRFVMHAHRSGRSALL